MRKWRVEMGDLITVNSGNVISGTPEDDLFQIVGAPSSLDGGSGFDIASVTTNLTFLANSIFNIERFDVFAGVKLSFANLTAGYLINAAAGGAKGINVTGSGGADTIYGGEQADTIDGLQGNDVIYGGGGNDTLTGGPGYDSIFGGAGDDFIQVKRGTGGDLIDGGAGIDRLSLDSATRTENIILDITDPNVTQYLAEGSVISGIEQLTAVTGSGFDRLTGGALADSLTANDGDDILKGAGGNDILDGGNGYDVAMYSGKAADYTVTSLGSGKYQVSSAAEGVDTLSGIETLRFLDGDRPIGGYSASASYWGTTNGSGKLIGATHIPDGRGATPGTGFTITGLVRLTDGSFWASNEGQADATDTTYTPSLVHIAADGVTKLGEIVLPSTVRAVQGLGVDEATGRLFYASLSERMIRIVNYTGAQLGSYKLPQAANALTFDPSTNSLVYGLSKGATPNTIVQWMSLSTGAITRTLDVGVNPDHLFVQTDKGTAGTLYVTYGEAPGTGYVSEFDIATGTKTGIFALPEADAIEGISIKDGIAWVANDAYYHHGNPTENRIEQFVLSDNATQIVRTGASVSFHIDLGLHDQSIGDGTQLIGVNRLYFAGGTGDDVVVGGRFDDVLVGNEGRDTLSGQDGQDRLVGGDGDDDLSGGAGDDKLEGAGGVDVAHFAHSFADYSFSKLSDVGVLVADTTAGRDGSDIVSDVEYFAFSDGTFSFNELFAPPAPLGALSIVGQVTDENSSAGTPIGSLSIVNPENVPISYMLLDDAGGRFALDGASLVAGNTPIDFEQAASYQVKVRAIDMQHNRVVDTTFTIGVNDVNEAVTDIAVKNLTNVSELSFFQVKIADVSVVDPDVAAQFISGIVTVNDDRFFVENGALYLKFNQLLNHDAEPQIDLTLSVADDAAHFSRHLVVTVDKATVPTSIALEGGTVEENRGAGTLVGALALGPGAAGIVSYDVLTDADGLFALDGNKLVLKKAADYEVAKTHLVTVRGTDQAGRFVDQLLTVAVTDANDAPTSLTLSNVNYLPDHTSYATHVADLSFADQDQDPAFKNYQWQVSDSRFEVVSGSLFLKAGQTIDSASGSTIPVQVTLIDGSASLSTNIGVEIRSATEGDDRGLFAIFGTSGADKLSGLGGHDEIYGYGGNDVIDGGSGNDSIYGGEGNDSISGGLGDDIIDGGSGADTVDGGAGIDAITYASATAAVRVDLLAPSNNQGDALGDVLTNVENVVGSSFADRIQGNNSANSIYGGLGADIISGGGGADKLYGNEGDDNLAGQGGNDLIDGGAGNDTSSGGSGGADTFVFAGGWGKDVITDYEANLDILDFKSGGISISDLTVVQVGADTWIYGPAGESLRIMNVSKSAVILQAGPAATGPVLNLELSSSSIAENAPAGKIVGILTPTSTGTTSNFSLALLDDAGGRFAIQNGFLVATGAPLNYELSANYLVKIRVTDESGKSADKSFNIGLTDTNDAPTAVNFANQSAILENTALQTKIADILVVDEDSVSAFKNYTYTVSDDRFTVIGSSLYLKSGQLVDYEATASIPLTITVHDGAFDFAKDLTISVVDVNEASGPLTFTGSGDNDIITTDADVIFGKRGDDLITATNPYKVTVSGGGGNDHIVYQPNGVGFAVIHGDDQNDYIVGASGNDQLYGDGGNDYVDAGAGNDYVDGGDSDDTLLGGAGNDTIYGGTGADTVFGQAGDDKLYGGTDSDILIGGSGADLIDGGMGVDAASYADATAGVRADLKSPANNLGDAKGDIYVDIENLVGSSFDDQLSGNDGSNSLTGGEGNDTLNGMGGTDILLGGAGNDRLNGQGGSDTLNGGLGDDVLSGGTSSIDVFVFDRAVAPNGSLVGWGRDTITDFEHGSDHINFRGTGLTFADLTILQVGNDTVISDLLSGSSVTLTGVNSSIIGTSDFYF